MMADSSTAYRTQALFAKVTKKAAAALGYDYPQRAEDCAAAYLKRRSQCGFQP